MLYIHVDQQQHKQKLVTLVHGNMDHAALERCSSGSSSGLAHLVQSVYGSCAANSLIYLLHLIIRQGAVLIFALEDLARLQVERLVDPFQLET